MTEFLIITGVLALLFIFLICVGYRQEKANLKRYESILEDIEPGVRYPYWRLEEMLAKKAKK